MPSYFRLLCLVLLVGVAAAAPANSAGASPVHGSPAPGHGKDARQEAEVLPRLPATGLDSERARRALGNLVVLGGRDRVWMGEPISLSLRDADLVEVLRSFARLADVNLVVDPRVEGKVSLELKEVPWDQALHVILKTHGLGAEIDGRIWGVGPAAAAP